MKNDLRQMQLIDMNTQPAPPKSKEDKCKKERRIKRNPFEISYAGISFLIPIENGHEIIFPNGLKYNFRNQAINGYNIIYTKTGIKSLGKVVSHKFEGATPRIIPLEDILAQTVACTNEGKPSILTVEVLDKSQEIYAFYVYEFFNKEIGLKTEEYSPQKLKERLFPSTPVNPQVPAV